MKAAIRSLLGAVQAVVAGGLSATGAVFGAGAGVLKGVGDAVTGLGDTVQKGLGRAADAFK